MALAGLLAALGMGAAPAAGAAVAPAVAPAVAATAPVVAATPAAAVIPVGGAVPDPRIGKPGYLDYGSMMGNHAIPSWAPLLGKLAGVVSPNSFGSRLGDVATQGFNDMNKANATSKSGPEMSKALTSGILGGLGGQGNGQQQQPEQAPTLVSSPGQSTAASAPLTTAGSAVAGVQSSAPMAPISTSPAGTQGGTGSVPFQVPVGGYLPREYRPLQN